jgi:hypothetical protein
VFLICCDSMYGFLARTIPMSATRVSGCSIMALSTLFYYDIAFVFTILLYR